MYNTHTEKKYHNNIYIGTIMETMSLYLYETMFLNVLEGKKMY